MKYTRDQHLKIAENIKNYGGSFIKCIGEALIKADEQNAKKLEEAFAEEFERYLNF